MCKNFRIIWFKLMNFCTINKQVTIFFIIMQAQTIFLLFSVKLIEYIFSALSVCSNPCAGPLPRNKISFFSVINLCWWTNIYTKNYYISAGSSWRVWKKPMSIKSNSLIRKYPYLSISTFLVNLTAPNKQFSSVG